MSSSSLPSSLPLPFSTTNGVSGVGGDKGVGVWSRNPFTNVIMKKNKRGISTSLISLAPIHRILITLSILDEWPLSLIDLLAEYSISSSRLYIIARYIHHNNNDNNNNDNHNNNTTNKPTTHVTPSITTSTSTTGVSSSTSSSSSSSTTVVVGVVNNLYLLSLEISSVHPVSIDRQWTIEPFPIPTKDTILRDVVLMSSANRVVRPPHSHHSHHYHHYDDDDDEHQREEEEEEEEEEEPIPNRYKWKNLDNGTIIFGDDNTNNDNDNDKADCTMVNESSSTTTTNENANEYEYDRKKKLNEVYIVARVSPFDNYGNDTLYTYRMNDPIHQWTRSRCNWWNFQTSTSCIGRNGMDWYIYGRTYRFTRSERANAKFIWYDINHQQGVYHEPPHDTDKFNISAPFLYTYQDPISNKVFEEEIPFRAKTCVTVGDLIYFFGDHFIQPSEPRDKRTWIYHTRLKYWIDGGHGPYIMGHDNAKHDNTDWTDSSYLLTWYPSAPTMDTPTTPSSSLSSTITTKGSFGVKKKSALHAGTGPGKRNQNRELGHHSDDTYGGYILRCQHHNKPYKSVKFDLYDPRNDMMYSLNDLNGWLATPIHFIGDISSIEYTIVGDNVIGIGGSPVPNIPSAPFPRSWTTTRQQQQQQQPKRSKSVGKKSSSAATTTSISNDNDNDDDDITSSNNNNNGIEVDSKGNGNGDNIWVRRIMLPSNTLSSLTSSTSSTTLLLLGWHSLPQLPRGYKFEKIVGSLSLP
jgi:hypothetical protein